MSTLLIARILETLLTLPPRVWEEMRKRTSFIVLYIIMLRWPSVYEERLARLERGSVEQLALGQTAAERSARASTQPLDEPDSSGINKSQTLLKHCVLEWQGCVLLNTTALALMGALFSITPEVPVCRTLLYLAFAIGFWALVIATIYVTYFRHVQDSEESVRWLSAYRTKAICTSYFLALPTVWSTWALLFLTVSFLSYVWTSLGEPNNSSPSTQIPDGSELAGHTTYLWPRFLPTAIFPVALWNIWTVCRVISNSLNETL